MIYVTGDTHGEKARFMELNMKGEESFTTEDYLIVCGDFGYIFLNNEKENAFLDKLQEKPYTICFVDGNHENFPAIYSYPIEEWRGGKIHRIRRNVVHLMRGQVFEICGKKIFTMGGAYSVDRALRQIGFSYWKEELPTNEEYEEAIANLKKHGNEVDYILTHTAPKDVIRMMGFFPDYHDAELTGFFEYLALEIEFKKWFFGHLHEDKVVHDKFRAIWMDVETLE